MFRSVLRGVFRGIVSLLPDRLAIQLMYARRFHRLPNLEQPQTLNEKLNWRKLYQRDPRFSVYADKIAVKDEIAQRIGVNHIIPTLWCGDKP